MSFAADYLAQLAAFAARGPLTRVRRLHLPPPAGGDPADNKGEFCAVELEDGAIGLAYALLDDTLDRLRGIAAGNTLAGTDALQLAQGYAGTGATGRTLGFAAANALTRSLFDRAGYRPDKSGDSIGGMDPQPGERIGMIGLFRPLLGRILERGAQLTVVELKQELAGDNPGYRVTLDASELAGCAKVLSTSTLLLNDTLDRMLAACHDARWFAMVGPGAGCLPDALFARGVTLLGGNWIVDGAAFLDALARGASTSEWSYKFAVTQASYPGFPLLLERAAGRSSDGA